MIAGYVRLSRDDDKKNYSSIENQKLIIDEYAAGQGMVIGRWYEDDGVSGYQFDRPSFSLLMKDLGEDVDTIIAKDLSRIGRHNAKVLLLLEELKERGKRLLLVDDGYDTYEDNDDIIGIKTWYNERYIKDTSKKIRRVLHARQREGTLRTAVPFGYCRNPMNRNLVEIVASEVAVIQMIYKLYLEGMGYRRIAGILTNSRIPTPSMAMEERFFREGKTYRRIVARKWTDSMVAQILKNDYYIGNLRLHKRERNAINGTDHRVAKERQIVFSQRHEEIIREEIFNQVQESMKKRNRTNYGGKEYIISNIKNGEGNHICNSINNLEIHEKDSKYSINKIRLEDNQKSSKNCNRENIFAGILYCEDCGSRLIPITRRNQIRYYICSTYNSKGKEYCQASHLVTENDLIQDVINYIRFYKDILGEKIQTVKYEEYRQEEEAIIKRLDSLYEIIENCKTQLRIILNQKILDISINQEDNEHIQEAYTILQENIVTQLRKYEQEVEVLKKDSKNLENGGAQQRTPEEIISHILEHKNLNYKDINHLIQKIIVDKEGNRTIELKHNLNFILDEQCKPNKILNHKENDIMLTIIKLVYESKTKVLSITTIISQLTHKGYRKTKKEILPYINFLMDIGLLRPLYSKNNQYEIIVSKEEILCHIKRYTGSMSNWWYAGDGI